MKCEGGKYEGRRKSETEKERDKREEECGGGNKGWRAERQKRPLSL